MNDDTSTMPDVGGSAPVDPQAFFHPGPIHLQPTGEEMFEGGYVGGLHLGPGGDRLPGADPLYDGTLEARLVEAETTPKPG